MSNDRINLHEDGLMKAMVASLWFCGVFYLLLGVVLSPMIGWLMSQSPEGELPTWFNTVMGAILFAVSVACAAGNFAVARAIQKRRSWGWVGAVIIGAIYAPSGCFPFGLLILFAVLRPGVHEAYKSECELSP